MAEAPRDWNARYASKETPWDTGRPSLEWQRLLAERSIQPGDALEIGCGTGTNAVYLAQHGFKVTAFDLVPLAIEQAKARAARAGVAVDFHVGDVFNPPDFGRTFNFVFDRGVYHCVRGEGVERFLSTLKKVTAPGSLYFLLTGNANEPSEPGKGPPRVHAHELCAELAPLFELVQLREFHFDGIMIDGQNFRPLGWSALLRRKAAAS